MLRFVFTHDQRAGLEESLEYLGSDQFSSLTSACKQITKGFGELSLDQSIMDWSTPTVLPLFLVFIPAEQQTCA